MEKRNYLLLFVFMLQFSFLSCSIAQKTKPVQQPRSATDNAEQGLEKVNDVSSKSKVKGYLPFDQLPNSLLILPPPPDSGSVAFQLDEFLATHVYNFVSQGRKDTAILDANVVAPFDSIVGITISPETTPILSTIIDRACKYDAGGSTVAAKNFYQRKRPFMYNHCFTCTPDIEKELSGNGSYPSGHATLGWAYALILSEIFPEKTTEIMIRGKEFGISRNVCNAHWHSDVQAGRMMASATVAMLHSNPEFMRDLAKAKKEVALILKKQGR